METNVQHLDRNTQGRDFFVGDLHGCFDLLDALMVHVAFDESKDRLISCGDWIDRGEDSGRCLDYLNKPCVFSVSGNHESMLVDRYLNKDDEWDNDDKEYYRWFLNLDEHHQKSVIDKFNSLPVLLDVPTPMGLVGAVHGEIPFRQEWFNLNWDSTCRILDNFSGTERQVDLIYRLLWDFSRLRSDYNVPIEGIDWVCSGHAFVPRPTKIANVLYLDTGAFRNQLYGNINASLTFLNTQTATFTSCRIKRGDFHFVDHSLDTQKEIINATTSCFRHA